MTNAETISVLREALIDEAIAYTRAVDAGDHDLADARLIRLRNVARAYLRWSGQTAGESEPEPPIPEAVPAPEPPRRHWMEEVGLALDEAWRAAHAR